MNPWQEYNLRHMKSLWLDHPTISEQHEQYKLTHKYSITTNTGWLCTPTMKRHHYPSTTPEKKKVVSNAQAINWKNAAERRSKAQLGEGGTEAVPLKPGASL
jgi:hypothetical protein